MSRQAKSRHWHKRQEADPYVKESRQQGYRSRAVFKLKQIDQRDKLLQSGMTVLDVGSAPGGWSQYAAEKKCRVVAVDILKMSEIERVDFIHGDITDAQTIANIKDAIGEDSIKLVICDLAPNLTGNRFGDQARTAELANVVLDFALETLAPGGSLLQKLFAGEDAAAYRRRVKQHFTKLIVRKPDASRSGSSEFYLLAKEKKSLK